MTGLVNQNREIFHLQLLIQRKREEIANLDSERRAAEADFFNSQRELDETANQFSTASAQAEAAVARARRASEIATKKRMDLQKQMWVATQANAAVRADIAKQQEQLDRYREYHDFILKLTPDGHTMEEFYSDPLLLAVELDRLHEATLFLINQVTRFAAIRDQNIERITDGLNEAEQELATIPEVQEIEECAAVLSDGNLRASDYADQELRRMTALVARAHRGCFGGMANLSAFVMIEQIETGLEQLHNRVLCLRRSYVQAKQKKKDEERLERQKKETAEKKAADFKLKSDQALERAQKPIKKRTGRPPIKRVLPIRVKQKDPEVFMAEQTERERVERLLYGDVDDQ
jgi:hypothetical protein